MDKVFFESKDNRLCGVFIRPDADIFPVVVFSHGLHSGKSSSRNTAIADALKRSGIGSFLFDFSGHGESQGRISNDVVLQQSDDLDAALDFVKTFAFVKNVGVSGSSLGGTVALHVLAHRDDVSALCLRSPVPDGTFEAAKRIGCPVLVVQGERDVEIREHSEELMRYLKNGTLFVIKDASHLYDDPVHFGMMVDRTVRFFEEVL